jgi:glycosyltransferase involved in cell wall biosynthesis
VGLSSDSTTVSVIIPVYNGGSNFRVCLSSVADCVPPPHEIIVVADGDTDGSSLVAREFTEKVVRLSAPGGPARARNRGAGLATEGILFFVDADVTVPQGAIGKIIEAFQDDPDLAAIIGSYDDEPFEPNFLSQYKNLLHHYVHQTANQEASTFWGACGAIRRNVFALVDGFDEGYRRPCIEDIELGYRLKGAGYRICLIRELQVKHLKRWTARSLLQADFFDRALPWSELIIRDRCLINDLNLKTADRISVISVFLLVSTLAGSLYAPLFLVPAAFLMIILLWLNHRLYRFFMVKRGFGFALKTIPWHWFYFLYSGIAFSIGLTRQWVRQHITPLFS